jgi:hypothetical protein
VLPQREFAGLHEASLTGAKRNGSFTSCFDQLTQTGGFRHVPDAKSNPVHQLLPGEDPPAPIARARGRVQLRSMSSRASWTMYEWSRTTARGLESSKQARKKWSCQPGTLQGSCLLHALEARMEGGWTGEKGQKKMEHACIQLPVRLDCSVRR